MNAVTSTISFEQIAARIVRLRDALQEADAAHKERTQSARDTLDQLKGQALQMLQATGQDSAKSKAGTVYITNRKSATIADGALFRDFVIKNSMFDLIDWRANAGACSDFITEKGTQPPGINYSVKLDVGVRRGK